jgi:hypothetical protein
VKAGIRLASWQEIQHEATQVVVSAAELGITVRIMGSAGIRMHCARAARVMEEIERPAKDLDLVVPVRDRAKLRSMLEELGYVVDRDLLVAMEGRRFAFNHPDNGVDVDVFVEKLEFCHTIELGGRWDRHPTTIPIEDLLLQKLQVHEPTQSDVIDTAVLLATHEVGSEDDAEQIDPRYVADLLSRDWAFHRDATANLARVRSAVGRDVPLPKVGIRRLNDASDRLMEAIDGAKKTMAWRMRARVGERVQWWDEVDERTDTY